MHAVVPVTVLAQELVKDALSPTSMIEEERERKTWNTVLSEFASQPYSFCRLTVLHADAWMLVIAIRTMAGPCESISSLPISVSPPLLSWKSDSSGNKIYIIRNQRLYCFEPFPPSPCVAQLPSTFFRTKTSRMLCQALQ